MQLSDVVGAIAAYYTSFSVLGSARAITNGERRATDGAASLHAHASTAIGAAGRFRPSITGRQPRPFLWIPAS
jgi:hypothetical protein